MPDDRRQAIVRLAAGRCRDVTHIYDRIGSEDFALAASAVIRIAFGFAPPRSMPAVATEIQRSMQRLEIVTM